MSLVLSIGLQARANVIAYDTIGPDNGWEWSGVWFGKLGSTTLTIAMQFTPTVSGEIVSLQATIFPDAFGNADRSWTLRVLADNNNTPGAVLWSVSGTTWPVAEPNYPDFYGELFHLDDLTGPWLSAGQVYWVQADQDPPISAPGWRINNQGYTGLTAQSYNGAPWQYFPGQPTFGLRLFVVPEPAFAGLFPPALVLLRRRRI